MKASKSRHVNIVKIQLESHKLLVCRASLLCLLETQERSGKK